MPHRKIICVIVGCQFGHNACIVDENVQTIFPNFVHQGKHFGKGIGASKMAIEKYRCKFLRRRQWIYVLLFPHPSEHYSGQSLQLPQMLIAWQWPPQSPQANQWQEPVFQLVAVPLSHQEELIQSEWLKTEGAWWWIVDILESLVSHCVPRWGCVHHCKLPRSWSVEKRILTSHLLLSATPRGGKVKQLTEGPAPIDSSTLKRDWFSTSNGQVYLVSILWVLYSISNTKGIHNRGGGRESPRTSVA